MPGLAIAIEDRLNVLFTLIGLARVACERGDLERAGRLWGSVEADVEREPPPQEPSLRSFAAPLACVSDPTFLAARAEGSAHEIETAVESALGDGGQTLP